MDYLSFAIERWDTLFGCRKAVMLRLARQHKLLLDGPPGYIRDLLRFPNGRPRARSGITRHTGQFYSLASKLHLTSERIPGIAWLCGKYHIRQIRRALEKLQFGPLTLLMWQPKFVDMLGHFGEQVSCYYVYDDFANFLGQSEAERRRIEENEERMLRSVDIVFTAGAGLFNSKNRYGNAVNVPNGVDFEFFSRALSADIPIPVDLKAIPEPRVGYLGRMNEKVDLDLLEQVAAQRPGWSFVFVGAETLSSDSARKQFASLRSHSNVYFLDRKPSSAIPNYLRWMSVCLIPYCLSGWSYFGCPLKLHEYLAAGKPVVASPIPSVCEFRDVVSIACEPAEWVAAIKDALAESDAEATAKRVAVAQANSWESRIELIEKAIADKVAEKQNDRERASRLASFSTA